MKFKKIIILLGLSAFTLINAQAQKFNMLVGTYTSPTKPDGIFVYEFDSQTGKTTLKSQVAVESPSYITLSPDEKFVYAVSEGRSANVNALSFDKKTSELKVINAVK